MMIVRFFCCPKKKKKKKKKIIRLLSESIEVDNTVLESGVIKNRKSMASLQAGIIRVQGNRCAR